MEDETRSIHEQRFDAAVKVIQSLPANGSFQPSREMMLKFYSYYKQATQGPCDIPRPGFWDPVGKVKWDAWNTLGDMPKEEAMMAYVDDLKLILESMPMTEQVEELLQVIGPFYEIIDDRKKKINQISDLTAGISDMMSAPSKSITKSIVRTMEMNGTLDGRNPHKADPPGFNAKKTKGHKVGGEDDDEDDSRDEENEEEEESQRLHKASAMKNRVWAAKGLPNGGIDHSAPPVMNGTHCSKSSLNEDAEENGDEIQHVNGHVKDDHRDTRSAQQVASDSDSEDYCDSMDQFAAEENGDPHMRATLGKSRSTRCPQEEPYSTHRNSENLLRGPDSVQDGGEDGKTGGGGEGMKIMGMGRPDSTLIRRGQGARSSGSGDTRTSQGDRDDKEHRRSGKTGGIDLNEQIVAALTRLQEDMQSVLERLHTLEALTASQARSAALPSEYLLPPASRPHRKPSWWPFDVSPGTVAFALAWPFIAQWIIRLYFQQRKRKLR